MTPEQHQRVKALFGEACSLQADARLAFLTEHCADPEIRGEVEALLGHDQSPNDGLRTPALGIALTSTLGRAIESSHKRETPTRIGHYRIVRPLGEGGMGIVYVAEQDRPRRTVALKVIRRGFGASGLLKRFEHEAELLGRLHHPGIAQIYEAGIADEGSGPQPFIAMEMVEGPNLLDHVSIGKPPTRRKLELLIKIADAVQHAHTRGVIHRDLKPANILVDSTGQPKVLDFGVARATDQDMQLTSFETSLGQLVGTLPYMSPEQVSGDTSEVDNRSDVYALGVILYQLLTGRLPLNLAGHSIPEMARIIRDDSPMRLSTIDKVFRGDIETIVAKAMDKDRSRRYQTASELAEDLRRHLAGQPIAARHDSAMYVLRKQLRRYRGAVTGALVFLLLLIGFAVFAAIQAGRQATLARIATRELTSSNIERGRLLGRLGNLRQAEDILWPVHLNDPESSHARGALWELYESQPLEATWKAHEGSLTVAAISPDQHMLVTSGVDLSMKVWNLADRSLVKTWLLDVRAECGTFGPSGTLFTGDRAGMVTEWDLVNGTPIRTWRGCGEKPAIVWAVEFSPDGSLIATGSHDGTVSVFEAATGSRLAHFVSNQKSVVSGVRFSPDQTLLATAGQDKMVHLWNWRSTELVQSLKGHTMAVTNAQFIDGGSRIVSGSADKTIKLWDVKNGNCLRTLSGSGGTVRALTLSPDEKWLVSGGWWTADLWDVRMLCEVQARPGVEEQRLDSSIRPGMSLGTSCNRAVFTADSRTLVIGDAGERGSLIRVWGLEPWDAARPLGTPGNSVMATAFDPTGTRIAAGSAEGLLDLLDASSGAVHWSVQTGMGNVWRTVFSPDGSRIAVSTRALVPNSPGHAAIFDAADGTLLVELKGHLDEVTSLRYTPDGRQIITCSSDRRLRIFDAASGALQTELRAPESELEDKTSFTGEVLDAAVSPDGETLVTVTRVHRIDFWSLPEGTHQAQIMCRHPVWTVEYSHDGEMLAITTWGPSVELWDARTRKFIRELRDHRTLVTGAAFLPGDGFLASSSSDGAVMVWDITTGRNIISLPARGSGLTRRVVGSPTGSLIAVPYGEDFIGLWDLTHADARIEANRAYQASRLGTEQPGN